jgi:biotin-dependent carboxylase-like uncharacterized protein
MIEVISPGVFATVQDLGRPGLAEMGVGESGAADVGSLARANALVGNPPSAAGVELTFGGLRARFAEPAVVAVTGAPCPLQVDGAAVGMDEVLTLPAGAELRVGRPRQGLRTYLSVRGGITVPAVLGSRSTDVLSGVGPPALRAGVVLPVGSAADSTAGRAAAQPPDWRDEPVLHVIPGPRDDWFTAEALAALVAEPYRCTTDTNRVGMRLEGAELTRRLTGELPSEGMVRGSLQVPPSGQPIVFLADHPVTGGYPVIAVVADADLDAAAQVRPGQSVRFAVAGGS